MAWITASDVKTYLNISSGTDDALLASLIVAAQSLLERTTGRTFEASVDTTRYFDAVEDVDGRTLYVWDDLCAITSVVNGDGVAVNASQYLTEPRHAPPYYALRLKIATGLTWTYTDSPENAIAITGRWGYAQTCPPDVRQACLDLVVYWYRRRGGDGGALDRPQVSPSGVTLFPPGFPQSVKEVIQMFRRPGR